jgi:predicted ATPase
VIRRVRLRRFKRFEDTTFHLPGHIVIAGPNNTGKTTLLQAVAAWSLALTRWRELDDYGARETRLGRVFYAGAPIARQAFAVVPLRQFDLLWSGRRYERGDPIEIEIATDEWALTMQFDADTTEQIYVRPAAQSDPRVLREARLSPVFVPAMTGLSIDEPVYQPPKVNELLALAKPGDVLRNLLLEANARGEAWQQLTVSIRRLFRFELIPPDARGAHILAEYTVGPGGPRFDLASAGSGFQQVLMLLAFLYARPSSVLLLDEPDAHLHVILQDAIYGELTRVAASTGSQLIIATHSEVIINAVDARELCVLLDQPRMLADNAERQALIASLRVLSNEDIMLALAAPGVLYLEGHTDLDILRAFARALKHRAEELLTTHLFWKPIVADTRPGGPGIKAREHYQALKLVRPTIPGLELVDGDSRADIEAMRLTGTDPQRWRWRRYEIESYLLHPDALARFVTSTVGEAAATPHVADLRKYLADNLPPAVMARPLDDHAFLNATKARTDILPPALSAAGLPGLPYTRYSEIAALMRPEEIHPDVSSALDAIVTAFGQ